MCFFYEIKTEQNIETSKISWICTYSHMLCLSRNKFACYFASIIRNWIGIGACAITDTTLGTNISQASYTTDCSYSFSTKTCVYLWTIAHDVASLKTPTAQIVRKEFLKVHCLWKVHWFCSMQNRRRHCKTFSKQISAISIEKAVKRETFDTLFFLQNFSLGSCNFIDRNALFINTLHRA